MAKQPDQVQADQENVSVEDLVVKILIICKDKISLGVVSSFLNRRGWPTHVVDRIDHAIKYLAQDKVDFVLISANHPNPKLGILPVFLAQTFNLEAMVFGEVLDIQTVDQIHRSRAQHKFVSPISGPSIHRKITQILKERYENPVAPEEPSISSPGGQQQNADTNDGIAKTHNRSRRNGGKKKTAAELEKEQKILDRINSVLRTIDDQKDTKPKTPGNVIPSKGAQGTRTTIVGANSTAATKRTKISGSGIQPVKQDNIVQEGQKESSQSIWQKGQKQKTTLQMQKGSQADLGVQVQKGSGSKAHSIMQQGSGNHSNAEWQRSGNRDSAKVVAKGVGSGKGLTALGTLNGEKSKGAHNSRAKGNDVSTVNAKPSPEPTLSQRDVDELLMGKAQPPIEPTKPSVGNPKSQPSVETKAPQQERAKKSTIDDDHFDHDLKSLMDGVMQAEEQQSAAPQVKTSLKVEKTLDEQESGPSIESRESTRQKTKDLILATSLSQAIQRALKRSIERPRNRTKHLVVATEVMAIVVRSVQESGVLVMSTSLEEEYQSGFVEKFEAHLNNEVMQTLEGGKTAPTVSVELAKIKFQEWANLHGQFLLVEKHLDGEIAATFVAHEDPDLTTEKSNQFKDKTMISPESLSPEIVMPCDLHLFMSANNKILHYVSAGGTLSEKQIDKLIKASKWLMVDNNNLNALRGAYIKALLFNTRPNNESKGAA